MGKANTAANASLYYEAGQTLVSNVAMTDSGDHKKFTTASAAVWSDRSGFEASVRPDGLITGGVITPDVGTSDSVDVAALTCYLAGVLTSVDAASVGSLDRPSASPTGLKIIVSIIVNSSGTLVSLAGTEGASFSTTRGAEGGPPLITAGAIEIGQVKLNSSTPAEVTAAEIFQVVGSSQERWDYPTWAEYPEGENGGYGYIQLVEALPAVHAGSPATYKQVYIEYYTPVFAMLDPVSDFIPPETSHSQKSTTVYGGALGSSEASINQGSFRAFLKTGVTENILTLKNEKLWFKFYPDRNSAPYVLAQGTLGISRTFPAGDSIQANCTVSAVSAAQERAS
jgi:hypothetical protein